MTFTAMLIVYYFVHCFLIFLYFFAYNQNTNKFLWHIMQTKLCFNFPLLFHFFCRKNTFVFMNKYLLLRKTVKLILMLLLSIYLFLFCLFLRLLCLFIIHKCTLRSYVTIQSEPLNGFTNSLFIKKGYNNIKTNTNNSNE